jgi:pimeloyl-ACP methyl ester carboxylesterase
MTHPGWLDRTLYPFRSHWMDTPDGRMHYVDEGTGPLVLFVHGTPTWSFLYRDLIHRLSATHRVVAPDHLGFGLSEKRPGAPYRPQDHAHRLTALIAHLGLDDLTLVVHDFGGPIGLHHAVNQPHNVARVVLFNTWMWSLEGDRRTERASQFMSGPVGRFLYTRLNFSARVLLKAVWRNRATLTRSVHRHYLAPFPNPDARRAPWALAEALIDSGTWYEGLWQRRDRIHRIPALFVWGMKDPTFDAQVLRRWEGAFAHSRALRLPEVGHFAMEEAPDQVGATVSEFVGAGVSSS